MNWTKFIAYSARNRDGRIDAQLFVIQILFKRCLFMVEKNSAIEFNPLDSSDKRCVNWCYWRGVPFDILKLKEIAANFSLLVIRFAIFR